MEIVLAKKNGFCKGVSKAVEAAMSLAPKNAYIYGEIIHNADIVAAISARGLETVEDLNSVPDGATLLIRSHGVGKSVYQECASRGIKIIDCTCEFVKRTQRIVDAKYQEGKTIVIVGDKTHPEVVGLNG